MGALWYIRSTVRQWTCNLCYRERPLHDVDDANRMGWGPFKLIAYAELGEGAGLLAEREYLILRLEYLSIHSASLKDNAKVAS